MASNKDSKTSKTAHVMNLLSKNRNAEPAAEPPAAAPQQGETARPAEQPAAQPAAPAPTAPIPPIISSINADAAVSSQIKDALEASLGQAEPARPAAAPAAPAQPPAPPAEVSASPAEPPAPPAEVPAPAPPAAPKPPVPQAEAPAPAAVSQPEPAPAAAEPPAYINVMQVLVEEKAEKYMRLSGMCCCDTCMVDVKAYALNHLPPKYVVMSKGEMIPKLTFYEMQHNSDITAQLMQACRVVSAAPHHLR